MSHSPSLSRYVEDRLLKARDTSFVDDHGITQLIVTEDGNARCSPSHTLPWRGSETFSNTKNGPLSEDGPIAQALVWFYENSLIAKEPMTANAIICPKDMSVPHNFLKRIDTDWDHDTWFIFNERTGLLTDKWWHIFGVFPS